MLKTTPEQLLQLPSKLTTGTTVFVHNPDPVLCKVIRTGLRSHFDHAATFVERDGEYFILEAKGGELTHLKPFREWVLGRHDNEFYISPAVVSMERIEQALGKAYDFKSAILYMPVYTLTGEWIGPIKDAASDKFFCFELSAWLREIPEWWKIVPGNFVTS